MALEQARQHAQMLDGSVAVRCYFRAMELLEGEPESPEHAQALWSLSFTQMDDGDVDAARASARKGQIGSGDRSQRIRTYNYPQGRVTDHRINLTLHKLDTVLEGAALDELVDALTTDHQASLLADMENA